jgi:hypothetical protein
MAGQMERSMQLLARLLAALLALVPAIRAQNAPHLAYVLPAGAQQDVTIQGK